MTFAHLKNASPAMRTPFEKPRPRLRRTTVIAIVLLVIFAFHLSDDYTHITPLYWQTASWKGDRLWDTQPIEPYWEWNHTTDANNLLLTQRHCEQAFHGLFRPIDQSVRRHRAPYNKVQLRDLDHVSGTKGVVRAMIYNQQLYIISTGGSISSRSLTVLSQIHQALITSPEEVSNIEFTFTADERPAHYSRSSSSTKLWSFARAPTDRKTWLMPDFTFPSGHETGTLESFHDVRRKAEDLESTLSWDQKQPLLHWRGGMAGLSQHEDFLDATSDAPWADVQVVTSSSSSRGHRSDNDQDPHDPVNPCKSKYLAYTSTPSYTTPLTPLQLCTSTLLIPSPLKWTTLFTHLLQPTGPDQNYLEVSPDWSDVEDKIRHLREWDTLGERIARNSVRMWRERYLTPAAEVCAWRRLMRGWGEVLGWEVEFLDEEGRERGVVWERFLMERVRVG